jgi:thiol-disulfide isomerase/thioredoxin
VVKLKKLIIITIIAIVLVGLAVFEQLRTETTTVVPTEELPKVGFLAPSFQLQTLEGGTLGVVRGKTDKALILNFWASWCEPCKEEAALLAQLHTRYKDQLHIYGINATEYDNEKNIIAFLGRYGITFPTLLDEASEISALYRVPGYPTSVFIDRNGVIQEIIIGLPGHQVYEDKVKKLIAIND